MDQNKIIIAVPKGRILNELAPIFEACGVKAQSDFYDESSRALRFSTSDPNLDLIRVRAFDVATFVAYGGAQMGIVGSDVLEEFGYEDLYAPVDLGIGRCRLSVAMPAQKALSETPARWSHVRVATKYPNLTTRHFAKHGVQAECIKLNGAMEIAPALGLCSQIVDLVSSGATLAANGLKEVQVIMDVSSRLVINRTAFKTRSTQINTWIERFKQRAA